MDKLTELLAWEGWTTVRGWVYNVTIAVLAVLMMYGLLNGQQAAAWLGLVAAVVGMARANLTPPDAEIEPADAYDPKHDA